MIKLFRKIRQNLLNEGKTSKYFKYAIGEIILVVIGILIALNINNWNEVKNNRNAEIKTLSQLSIDLKSNLNEIKDMLDQIIEANTSGKKILNHLDSNEQVTDSLKFWVETFNGRNIFNNANTTYKTIQNNTKNSITNDSLRLKITLMYERDFDNINKREKVLNEEFFALYQLELNKNFKTSPSISKYFENLELEVNTPLNLDQLKTNEHYKNVLIGVYNFRLLRIQWLKGTITDLTKLITAVDAEIKNLKTY
ncbi:MAG: DUF6090 family protein [Cellulophaga sp.]|nr:DUF6090 family protein [Cellulophaga sp.]